MMIRHALYRRLRFAQPRIQIVVFAVLCLTIFASPGLAQEPQEKSKTPPATNKKEARTIKLFDGKTLNGWKVTNFGGEGEVLVEDGKIVMEMGFSLTGITSLRKDLPTTNYEIQLEANRLDGVDFFCTLTFPVKDSHASLVVGGWAGAVVGISCIDDKDASQNETTKYEGFKSEQWYRIRVRVLDKRIQAWIDDKQMVDVNIEGRKLSTRPEVDLSRPLGIAAWETRSALRNISLRKLSDEEVAASK
jgi:hypothetical protein